MSLCVTVAGDVGRMSVTVHEARELPTKERGGSQHSQVRLMLLPTRKSKHRTKIRSGDDNPQFQEAFTFKVPPGQLTSHSVLLLSASAAAASGAAAAAESKHL